MHVPRQAKAQESLRCVPQKQLWEFAVQRLTVESTIREIREAFMLIDWKNPLYLFGCATTLIDRCGCEAVPVLTVKEQEYYLSHFAVVGGRKPPFLLSDEEAWSARYATPVDTGEYYEISSDGSHTFNTVAEPAALLITPQNVHVAGTQALALQFASQAANRIIMEMEFAHRSMMQQLIECATNWVQLDEKIHSRIRKILELCLRIRSLAHNIRTDIQVDVYGHSLDPANYPTVELKDVWNAFQVLGAKYQEVVHVHNTFCGKDRQTVRHTIGDDLGFPAYHSPTAKG